MTIRTLLVLATWTTLLSLSPRQAAAQEGPASQPTSRPAAAASRPAASQAATSQATSKPATSQPASSQAASQPVDPAVNAILDDTEKAGKEFHTIKGDVAFVENQTLFQEKKTFLGAIYFDKPTPEADARFRIHFDFIRNNAGARVRADRDVSFYADRDGRWLITRDGDIKQWRKYQVARPGENFDPLKLGKGPFPVPFGQDKAEVLRLFTVTTRPPTPEDPKDSRYLLLMPGKEALKDLNVSKVEMWVGKDGLPVQIRTADPEDAVQKTATFGKVEKNVKLPTSVFELPKPGADWDMQVELLKRPGEIPAGENP
jgi:hypothetical protein